MPELMRKPFPAPARTGFISLGCIAPIAILAFLWLGGQGIYTALKNREPLRMSTAEYLEKKPSAEWVSLTGSQFNLTNSAYITSKTSGEVTEVYFAVEALGSRDDKPAHILLASKKREMIDLMTSTNNKVAAVKSPDQMSPEVLNSLFPTQEEVSGLVRFGITGDSKTREKIEKLELALTPDFIIIEDGEKPNLLLSIFFLVLGIAGGISWMRYGRGKGAQTAPQGPNLPPLPPAS